MNVAIITAGGIGSRMNNDIPKQFLTVDNKPIIIYTLEAFENHPNIDMIIVACLSGWEPILKAYASQYKISKLKYIVPGGNSGQESITNCLNKLNSICNDDDIVVVHDGNRPLVSDSVISDALAVCISKGNAVAQIPCNEALVTTKDQETSDKLLDRDFIKRTQTPHVFKFKKLYDSYKRIKEMGITEAVAPVSVMIELGESVNFSKGSELNFKITNQNDLEMLESIIYYEKNHNHNIKRLNFEKDSKHE